MAIREGRWDCSSCGSTAIYGRHVDCPGCGRPRPAGVRFYLTDNAPVVTDPRQLEEARAGADWICAHCEAGNRATLHACGGCGAARGTSPTQPVQDFGMGAVPRTGASAGTPAGGPAAARGTIAVQPAMGAVPHTGMKAHAAGARTPPPAAASGRSYILHAVGAVFVGLFVLIGWAAFAGQQKVKLDRFVSYVPTPPVPAVVEGKRWERHIQARLRTLVPGQGYALPESAQVLTTQQRRTGDRRVVDHYVTSTREVERTVSVQDGYETVTEEVEETVQTGTRTYVCGQRDLGNGYFEDQECSEPEYETRTRTVSRRQPRYRDETRMETVTDRTPVYRTVPVYRTWYTWNRPVWRDTVYMAAGDTTQPQWPRVEPSAVVPEDGRRERYVILFRLGQDQPASEVEVSAEEWARYQPGHPVAIRERPYSYELLPTDSLPACINWHTGRGAAPSAFIGCPPHPDSLRADSRTDSLRADSLHADSVSRDSANQL
jgi:hypothetical protein